MVTDRNQGTSAGIRDDNASSTGGETVIPIPLGTPPTRPPPPEAGPTSLPQTPEGPAVGVRIETPPAAQEDDGLASPSRRRPTNLEATTRAGEHVAAPSHAEPNRMLQNILDHLGWQDARTDAQFASLAAAQAFSMDEINRLQTSRSANAAHNLELPGRPQPIQHAHTSGNVQPRDPEIAELRRRPRDELEDPSRY